jgi:LysM repeat protein
MGRHTVSKPARMPSRNRHVQRQSAKQPAQHPIMDLQQSIGNQTMQRLLHSPYIQKKLQVKEDAIQPHPEAGGGGVGSSNVESQIGNMRGTGDPLPADVREYFEPRLGRDFGEVRVHKGAQAAKSAEAINAKAFTTGKDIVFGAGEYAPETAKGKALIAHELTHVVQQGSGSRGIHRYEAGEHAQLGETQAELKALFVPSNYQVQKGDSLFSIAKKFELTPAEVREPNKDKIQKWPAKDGSGQVIEGFNTGVTILIPQKLKGFAKAATKDKSAKITINGVVMDYGVGIALGDLYETPELMAVAPAKELKALAALVKRERAGGKVTNKEWQDASRDRFLKLAEKNVAHFAPQSAKVAKTSAAGATSANHKSEWEKHHQAALEASKAGDKNKALMTNAFADHFLTDAFAAGHLINKTDVMELFKSQMVDAQNNLTQASLTFFNEIATAAFTGAVQAEFSKLETFNPIAGNFRLRINSDGAFSLLLQGIHRQQPDIMANAVARAVHTNLNELPTGLPVQNALGNAWNLSGDNTLNKDTKDIALKAVAQSQFNVISAFNFSGTLNTAVLFKRVWDFTPTPTSAGIKQMAEDVSKGTDITNAGLRAAVVKLITENHKVIIKLLIDRKELRIIK